jgi:hypothetical protein
VHILYYWHLADVQDIIRDVLSKIGEKACAPSTKPANDMSSVKKSRKHGHNSKEEEPESKDDCIADCKFRSSVGHAMNSMTYNSLVKNITKHRCELFALKKECRTLVSDEVLMELMDEEIAVMQNTIADLEQRRSSMTAFE